MASATIPIKKICKLEIKKSNEVIEIIGWLNNKLNVIVWFKIIKYISKEVFIIPNKKKNIDNGKNILRGLK